MKIIQLIFKYNKLKAFSLAEMMVVMLILSIVLAAAMPIITHRVIAREGTGSSGESIPSGAIIIWKGSAATIPDGWHLCDGTNGTPDLRSRFVYGAGGDTNTKPNVVSGWNTAASGHWAVGYTGGEETHILTTAEMPSHTHTGYTDAQGYHNHHQSGTTLYFDGMYSGQGLRFGGNADYQAGNGSYNTYTDASGSHSHNVYTYAAGSGSSHNILPRLYCLAYIMKL